MTQQAANGGYSHDLLLHDDDQQLVEGTRAFVGQGLDVGAQVLVHSSRERVALLRDAVGEHPRLQYAFDEDLYVEPISTLFAYQRQLATAPQPAQVWVTGTVPLGADAAAQSAWARYESLVNEALGTFDFHALCTYDTRTLPANVLAAARATHPTVSPGRREHSAPSADYVAPAAFLDHALADVPRRPTTEPAATAEVTARADLARIRHLLRDTADRSSALPAGDVEDLVTAVNEVVTNGLVHGRPPVRVTLWCAPAEVTCEVVDSGGAHLDPMAGFRYPRPTGSRGLWAARQLVDDAFVSAVPGGGSAVLLVKH
jgi:anti-sigma regulatory factor (Ser/Thr protein kinase)